MQMFVKAQYKETLRRLIQTHLVAMPQSILLRGAPPPKPTIMLLNRIIRTSCSTDPNLHLLHRMIAYAVFSPHALNSFGLSRVSRATCGSWPDTPFR
jgi:hypothetical protein